MPETPENLLPSNDPASQREKTPQWFAICTRPRYEKRVSESLRLGGIEHFFPVYQGEQRWKNGHKAQAELPLFPGYLFVKVSSAQCAEILEVPGVTSFISGKNGPEPLPEFKIDTLHSGLTSQTFQPWYGLVIGDNVRIKAGPLEGVTGVLVRHPNGVRVVITLEVIQQSVAVELNLSEIEILGPSSCGSARTQQENSSQSQRNGSSAEERIIEAAVQLFSRQGFEGSSTYEIARLAGVAEVTLYRHFPRKRDLFWAATESRLQRLRISEDLRSRLEQDEHPRTALPKVVSLWVETVQHQPEVLRLLYLSLFELGHGAERVLQQHLVPLFQPVSEYLSRCVSKGTIRDLKPEVATLGLAASVAAHQNLQSVLGENPALMSTDDAVSVYTDFWMKALVPEPVLSSTT